MFTVGRRGGIGFAPAIAVVLEAQIFLPLATPAPRPLHFNSRPRAATIEIENRMRRTRPAARYRPAVAVETKNSLNGSNAA
ncbi:MAG TPA: hypothetical protein VK403_07950 [Allosphingosinicella sp.]|nr:hypothetical protein [Allosphingosinicella sp.]